MSKTLDKIIYERAAKLVESGWTQGAYARNGNGVAVSPFAKTAVQFCAMGAIQRAMSEVNGKKLEGMPLSMKIDDANELIEMNDSRVGTQSIMWSMLKIRAS
jgi:hypothetical protein